MWYTPYPEGGSINGTAGATIWVNLRLRNTGTTAGYVYLILNRGDGGQIYNNSFYLARNAYVDIDNISFIMPEYTLTLGFEIGH